jgi:hypothetical protein
MLGFELEVCLPVTPPGGGTFPGDTDLGRSNVQPVDIETDYRQLPGGAIYSNIEFVSDAVSVIGVNPLAPGLPVVAQLLEVQRIRNAFYGAGAVTLPVACPVGVNYTPVGNTALLDPNNGYFEEAGQPGLGDGLYLQYSIGVPLRSFRLFLNRLRVVAPPELPRARFRLGQALNFANDVVALFQGLPPVPVGYDLRPLHSYLQLAFTQICAMADYLDDPVNEPQIKNCTVVLSRSSLTSVYNLLGPLERGYLQQALLVPVGNPHNIINRLANYQDLTETPGGAPQFQRQRLPSDGGPGPRQPDPVCQRRLQRGGRHQSAKGVRRNADARAPPRERHHVDPGRGAHHGGGQEDLGAGPGRSCQPPVHLGPGSRTERLSCHSV